MNESLPHKMEDHFAIDRIPGMTELWRETTGNEKICIAIIDGNIDNNHSCFKGANIKTVDITNTDSILNNEHAAVQHGTSIASIILGQHGSLVQGVAPGCQGIIVPIFREKDNVPTACSQLDLARSIKIAEQNGANIINISGGQFSSSGKSEPLLATTIEHCVKKGILIVSAAGNDGCECLHVPAAENSVLAVGAMDENSKPLDFSNWGRAYKENGILFPGKNILTAAPDNHVTIKTGTSFAAAIATGVSALLLSLMVREGLDPDGTIVRNALIRSATRCNDKDGINDCEKTLVGYLNLQGAVKELLDICRAFSPQPANADVATLTERPAMVMASELDSEDSSIQNHNHQPNCNTKKKEGTIMSTIDKTLVPPGMEIHDRVSLTESFADLQQSNLPGTRSVNPSECSCHNKSDPEKSTASSEPEGNPGTKNPYVLVYAIGSLSYEFRSEASRDSFQQAMNGNPDDPAQLLAYLEENPEAEEDVIWVLNLDATPIYAIYPMGSFAASVYKKLKDFYRDQLAGIVHRISVPGYIGGVVTLMSGQELPVIVPKGHGMYSWSTAALIEAVLGAAPASEDDKKAKAFNSRAEGLVNFLDRVYYELRNLGITSEERAINYAATNAFQIERVFEKAAGENQELDSITVEKSPICRPNSDCWDVKLIFFNPVKRLEQARKTYRFTIDVSNIIPVTVGGIRSWNIF